MRPKFHKSVYVPKNPKKYINRRQYCISRSSWERKFMVYLDDNDSVVKWGSECIAIRYFCPVANKVRKYFPDFWFQTVKGDKYLVEVKPLKQTKRPRKSKTKKRSTIIYEATTYANNMAKWNAAREFCKEHDWEFKIITEKDLCV